jgi:lipopolysaccharide transport system ATP-binding protein
MSEVAIRVEGLSKRYQLGAPQEKYKTFRDSVTSAMSFPVRAIRSLAHSNGHSKRPESIWALKDVSFEIKRGEVVGVIGRNGAGKSTLLKILSRITDPTEGLADIYGRVGSLLEVGTGFHPELTGRENTYLNGAILGMSRKEIDDKFDEIVAFAEIEKFLDTPVKHYSSGMYLRLAFAVAAHLNPEILIVDEVLAVGDAIFQKKCLGRMGEVAKEGRTILFVSHNMEAVMNLCPTSFVLDQGELVFNGTSEQAVRSYFDTFSTNRGTKKSHELYRIKAGAVAGNQYVTSIEVLDSLGKPKTMISTWDDITLRLHYHSNETINHGLFVLDVFDYKQQRLLVLDSGQSTPIMKGSHFVDCFVPRFPLSAGEYFLGAGLSRSNSGWLWRETNLASFRIHGRDVFEIGRPPVSSRMLFAVPHDWQASR